MSQDGPGVSTGTRVRTGEDMNARPLLNRRLHGFGTTVFAEMSALAVRTGSINLGQGFPDTDG
ncbi:N-succinyldiaminopimelate aminotransferase, partial [Streptomyces pini]